MKTRLLFGIVSLITLLLSFHRNVTSISGTVKDEGGSPVIFAYVSLYKNGVLISATETDFDGAYSFQNIEPGTYDLEASYVGHTSQRQTGIIVHAGKAVTLDFVLESGVALEEVEIVDFKIPLINQDMEYSGTVRSLRNQPTKNINALSATTAGLSRKGEINVRGSRTNATNYYIDGIRVSGTGAYTHEEDELSTEDYGLITDNQFLESENNPLSTFSIDVDRASYSNIRRFIQSGSMPPLDAVRIEEMVNYFDYEYPQPDKKPFSITTEMHSCPWNEDHMLLHVGLQGKRVEAQHLPASNLVFLVDVSGSMQDENKLPLVISSFKVLVEQLRQQDRIAIVVYAGAAGLVLPSTSGSEKDKIMAALDRLRAGGSTAGAAGIQLAYNIAREHFIKDGNNRVILATDGDFNVGVSSDAELVRLIEKERASGIFLTVLGYGMGNYKDNKMQELADHGNGNHAYIDGISEAKKVFVHEFGGTLFTIAKDVKIQVEFNPEKVQAYRLIGYENRMLAAEDFNDDKKDAGEIGSGHTVTALYEIIPAGVKNVFAKDVDPLKYQKRKTSVNTSESSDWATIKFRYKEPQGTISMLLEEVVSDVCLKLPEVSDNFKWAASVAAYGMILRDSEFKSNSTMDLVRQLAKESKGADRNGYRAEFIELVNASDFLASKD